MTGVPALAIIARMLIVVVGLPFGLYALLTRGRRRAIPQLRGCGGRTGLTVSPAALVWRSDEGVNDGGSVGGRRPNRARRRRNGWTEGEAGTWLEDRDRRPARPARGSTTVPVMAITRRTMSSPLAPSNILPMARGSGGLAKAAAASRRWLPTRRGGISRRKRSRPGMLRPTLPNPRGRGSS
jgi:hypothetical protein